MTNDTRSDIGRASYLIILGSLLAISSVHAQKEVGLSLSPTIEAGGSIYFASKTISATPSASDLALGLDIGFHTSPSWGFGLGIVGGWRRYRESYQFGALDYRLDHRVTDLGWRLCFSQTLESKSPAYWELCYGLSGFPTVGGRISVSNSAGDSGEFDTDEAGTFGFRFCAVRTDRSWMKGMVGIGVVANLQLSGAQRDLYVPWLIHSSLGVGRSRIFVGLMISVRALRIPWRLQPLEQDE